MNFNVITLSVFCFLSLFHPLQARYYEGTQRDIERDSLYNAREERIQEAWIQSRVSCHKESCHPNRCDCQEEEALMEQNPDFNDK